MAMNDRSRISGDYVAQSGLGTTSIAIEADGVSMADGAIQIELDDPSYNTIAEMGITEIKINDALFVLKGKLNETL